MKKACVYENGVSRRDPEEPSLGRNLKAARDKSGLSQAALAEKIGTAPVQIGRYERAEQEPTVSRLLQIAEALGVDPRDLIPIQDDTRWLAIDQPRDGGTGDIWQQVHLTETAAIADADRQWSNLSTAESRRRTVQAIRVTKADLSPEAIGDDGEVDWSNWINASTVWEDGKRV